MFSFKYLVKKEDINEGNHVGNERALLYFQYARTNFLKQYGLSQLNLGNNLGLIQVNAYVEYKMQIYLGDEIEVSITSINIDNLNIIFNYLIKSGDKVLIKGYTTMLCYDYSLKKVRRIPHKFLDILKEYQESM